VSKKAQIAFLTLLVLLACALVIAAIDKEKRPTQCDERCEPAR
jgi:hypothetical protein